MTVVATIVDPANFPPPSFLPFHGALSARGCGSANLRSYQEALPWTQSETNLSFLWHRNSCRLSGMHA